MADEQEFTRASRPLAGVVLCFTSIVHDVRSDLCNKAVEMGAVWKQDLTSDATHLIVGDSDTPKYKYVARQRPDVKAMTADFINAVRELWISGDDVPMEELEEKYGFPALMGFRICGTNLSEDERRKMSALVSEHGATYNGDLTKTITHLVAATPKGKKYDFAKQWGIKIVSPEWLYDSMERGMALEERYYDPIVPEAQRGDGAWIRPNPNKRKSAAHDETPADATAREAPADPNKRKIRKTASARLVAQSVGLWGDIIGQAQAPKPAKRDEWEEGDLVAQANTGAAAVLPDVRVNDAKSPHEDNGNERNEPTLFLTGTTAIATSIAPRGMFADMGFHVHSFDSEKTTVLNSTIRSFDGEVYSSIPALLGDTTVSRYFIIVPASLPASECPKVSDSSRAVQVATFWWVEKCMQTKEFVDPDDHPLLQPFKKLPIPGFEKLSLSISLFLDIDFLHVSRAIKEAGASWNDEFTRKTSVLIVNHKRLSQKRDKMEAAFEWKVPVVTDLWLLKCFSEGNCVPFDGYTLSTDGETDTSHKDARDKTRPHEEAVRKGPLSDCVVCISSKLKEHQAKLQNIAKSLGAKLVDSVQSELSPTHLLHLSKTSRDTSAEYKAAAKLPGCFTVSPQWLTSCKKAEKRLDEKDFPPFNIPESNRSTADSRLSATPPPPPPLQPPQPQREDSGPFIVEQDEPTKPAPPLSHTKRSSPSPAPRSKRSKPSPPRAELVESTDTDGKGRTKTPTRSESMISLPISANKAPLQSHEVSAPTVGNEEVPREQQKSGPEIAPKIMESLSELLQQASANAAAPGNRRRPLRGRLQGRAPSNNPLPPPQAATTMSRVSSTHSSVSVDENGSASFGVGIDRRPSVGSISNSNNNSCSLEEYSALDDMDPNGVLGSQAIHYADPEAQMFKRKMMEKLGVSKAHEGDAMMKGRTLSVMTSAAEGLNTRKRTTRSTAK